MGYSCPMGEKSKSKISEVDCTCCEQTLELSQNMTKCLSELIRQIVPDHKCDLMIQKGTKSQNGLSKIEKNKTCLHSG